MEKYKSPKVQKYKSAKGTRVKECKSKKVFGIFTLLLLYAFTLSPPVVSDVSAQSWITGEPDGPCGWWNPCPAVPEPKKVIARSKGDYFDSAAYNLGVITGALAFGLPESGIAFGVAGATAVIAKQMAADQRKIASDPWDWDYQYLYNNPPWPSPESLGLAYGDNPYLNEMISMTQYIAQLSDMIYVSANRASTCDSIQGANCGYAHRNLASWGLYMLGWAIDNLGGNAWVVAWQMDQERVFDLAAWVRSMAWESNDAGWRYQQ